MSPPSTFSAGRPLHESVSQQRLGRERPSDAHSNASTLRGKTPPRPTVDDSDHSQEPVRPGKSAPVDESSISPPSSTQARPGGQGALSKEEPHILPWTVITR